MEGTASANKTEYQPESSIQPERNYDVPATIHTGEAQPGSKHPAMVLPPMKIVRGNSDGNNEEEEQVDVDEKYGMVRKNSK